jgi:hypothetical protein
MPRIATGLALVGLVFALTVGAAAPASAEFFGCDDQHPQRAVGYACAPSDTRVSPFTHEFAAQTRRPRITIYPRRVHPGRNATRQCRSWLAKEYRVSGPVIVPRMQCWWE